MLKRVIAIACALICVLSLYAGGRKDNVEKQVEKPDSWQESIDISNKKPGKYNIVATATDQGGNVAIAGPFNVWIDPESDLPVAGVTNPLNGMRVPGNLNIVGTCVDDDGVSSVMVILDGDTERPIIAEGTDFWSVYLDTTELAEGPHTISVYGIDINGTQGHTQTVTWNLDRKAPETAVNNYALGTLVSGKITLNGTISDGNGIKSLEYSLDGGKSFTSSGIKYNKQDNVWTFSIPIDTKKMKDGPSVCWFKATDNLGTAGIYTFLYFVDNTLPDIVILYPPEGEEVNGVFSVAGYAFDTVGLESVSWSMGKEAGDFTLVPGNPYWVQRFDIRGQNVKQVTVEITAIDKAGNVSRKSRKIPVNQSADLPAVTVQTPRAAEVFFDTNLPRLDVTATDDDGVAKIFWSLDGGETSSADCEGIFSIPLAGGAAISEGKHSLQVWAQDIHGTDGLPVTVNFFYAGGGPAITAQNVTFGKNSGEPAAYTDGMKIDPESQAVFNGYITSVGGVASASWQFTGGNEVNVPVKSPQSKVTLAIPFSADTPYGFAELTIRATDIYGRKSTTRYPFYVLNLTRVRGTPGIYFTDSTVSSDGTVFLDSSTPVSGYFISRKQASSVSFVPDTNLASVRMEGNSIVITPSGQPGISPRLRVQVTDADGKTWESEELTLRTAIPAPDVTIDDVSPRNGFTPVTVSGTIRSDYAPVTCEYRILSAQKGEPVSFTPDADGTFSFIIQSKDIPDGVSVIEVTARNAGDSQTSIPLFVRKVVKKPPEDGKKAAVPAPVFTWTDSGNLYYTAAYPEPLEFVSLTVNGTPAARQDFAEGGIVDTRALPAGSALIQLTVKNGAGKTFSPSYTYRKSADAKLTFVSAGGNTYRSGMPVTLSFTAPAVKENGKDFLAVLDSGLPPVSVQYTIGDSSPAKASFRKTDVPNRYEISIPLKLPNGGPLPAYTQQITLTADIKDSPSVTATAAISVVRPADGRNIFDADGLYWFDSDTADVSGTETYILSREKTARAFYNGGTPVSAAFERPVQGLSLAIEGNIITVSAETEGITASASIVVTADDGGIFTSEPVSFLSDYAPPQLYIQVPLWAGKSPEGDCVLELKGTASDPAGIVSAEYSLDNGASWQALKGADGGTSVSFSEDIPLAAYPDGFIPVSVRVRDKAGRETVNHGAVMKDTVPPDVRVVTPAPGDIINGLNTLTFAVTENGSLEKSEFLPSDGSTPVELSAEPVITVTIGTESIPLADTMTFRFTDAAGNATTLNRFLFSIDPESDLPRAEIHLPEEDAVIQRDFTISGIVYDDDGPARVHYRIDDQPFTMIDEFSNNFSIFVPLSSLTDNEHTITVYAEDINGVTGLPVIRKIRVSLEEPKGQVVSPGFDQTVNGVVTITGTASDKNGIDRVQVSLDNGNSFNDAAGAEDWSYTFDSHVIPDGTHVVFFKVWDKYGIEGLYSSLINIDNTPPELNLELPLDDTRTSGPVFLSGQTIDNIRLEKLYVRIRNLSSKQPNIPEKLALITLAPDRIIAESLDLSVLPDGFYNLELTGEDAGGNTTRVSRNIQIDKTLQGSKIEFLYPMNGEHVQGMFNVYGRIVSEKPIETLLLYVDDKNVASTHPTAAGYYKFTVTPENISGGSHFLVVRGLMEGDKIISSDEQYIVYTSGGPWVTIDNLTMGDFAIDRPYLEGSAGYSFTSSDIAALSSKDLSSDERKAVAEKSVERVEISFDNGKTFQKADAAKKWRFRVETEDMAEGYHFLIVRAIMKNGETAVTRSIIQIDKTPPVIRLISPAEGGRFNDTMTFEGLSSDDVALESVNLSLRSGDKAAYEVPSFIQGLYFDWHFWGATLYDIGIGLTFFDDNVKLQFQFGQFTAEQRKLFTDSKMRYGGNVFGMKLLANLAYIPFRYFFGPDWAWLSSTVALGANFSMFTETQSGKPQILSAIIAQVEFPRITIPKQKIFRTFSFYTEVQLWFIPTDVQSGGVDITSIQPQISGGVRVNVF